VEARRQADATPIPKLSERAEAALVALAAATDEKVRAALWRGSAAWRRTKRSTPRCGSSWLPYSSGSEMTPYVRRSGGLVEAAAEPREHHAALAAVSRAVQALQEGRFASASQTEAARLIQRQAVAGGRWPRASHRPEVMAIRGGLVSIVLPTRWLCL
jgi:hypothetical protein